MNVRYIKSQFGPHREQKHTLFSVRYEPSLESVYILQV